MKKLVLRVRPDQQLAKTREQETRDIVLLLHVLMELVQTDRVIPVFPVRLAVKPAIKRALLRAHRPWMDIT